MKTQILGRKVFWVELIDKLFSVTNCDQMILDDSRTKQRRGWPRWRLPVVRDLVLLCDSPPNIYSTIKLYIMVEISSSTGQLRCVKKFRSINDYSVYIWQCVCVMEWILWKNVKTKIFFIRRFHVPRISSVVDAMILLHVF